METNQNLDIFDISDLTLQHLKELLQKGYEIDAQDLEEPGPDFRSYTLTDVISAVENDGRDVCDFAGHLYHPEHYKLGFAPGGTLDHCTWWDEDTFYCITQAARDYNDPME